MKLALKLELALKLALGTVMPQVAADDELAALARVWRVPRRADCRDYHCCRSGAELSEALRRFLHRCCSSPLDS